MNKQKLLFILYLVIYVTVFLFKIPTLLIEKITLTNLSIAVYVLLFIIGITLYHTTLRKNLSWIVHNKLKSLLILVLGYIGDNLSLIPAFFLINYLGITETLQNDSDIMIVSQLLSPITIIVVLGIIGPIVEELFYRQMLISSLSTYVPSWFAILISSFLFACLHMDARTLNEGLLVIPYFFSGIILGILYKKTDNILFPIILHVFVNVTGLIPLLMT
ncbi:hypothetical protein ATZ33_13295 [Enterococcus silesiacus]|uniref:CAAX prenyl protease 2/Lysostaphin resistance protein A-like domain-containing protein n=1 Tax=Enterococcus silesiacus TaxID=332949 RepID=A0ABN4JAP1_9ENTE|nr:type II CAAX endopeptidase family protein [Enterococcus silesiacus]ALS02325.1 hypothetical protein ATZ33_13295 [Enterococcus silesiacus]